MDATAVFATLTLMLGASWCAGINLYATVAVLGLLHRYVDGFVLPGDLAVLGSHWVIWPAVAMYAVEFVADKVPAVDSAWDTVHTFIRVPAGALIAAAAIGDVPLAMQVSAGLIGGTLALGSHTTKATTRVAAHSTGTSPIVSPVASLIEDGLVIGTIGFMAASPLVSMILLVAMVIASVVLMVMFWKLAKAVFRKITARTDEIPASALPGNVPLAKTA